jgi:endonuclease/exonuclease/phosphatase family metal-dependent hydrolase
VGIGIGWASPASGSTPHSMGSRGRRAAVLGGTPAPANYAYTKCRICRGAKRPTYPGKRPPTPGAGLSAVTGDNGAVADDGVLRLLTLNALFKGDVRPRMAAIGEVLRQRPYDVVCLQEVMSPASARLLARLAAAYPHRLYSGAALVKGGLVLLSRWPIERGRFVQYPFTRPVRPELLMRKGAQVTVLATPAGRVAVLNTHLSANRDDDWSAQNRYSAVARAELASLGAALAALPARLPAVVTGDLNLPRNSALLAGFCAEAGLRDAMAGDTRPTYRPTPGWPDPPAFDHVLLRGMTAECRLTLEDDTVTLGDGREVYLSDHFGVEADLRVDPQPG